jgi:hypothetical protein
MSMARWIYYAFYGSLLTVAAIYGYTATSFLIETTSSTPKFAAALLDGAHGGAKAPADSGRQPASDKQ